MKTILLLLIPAFLCAQTLTLSLATTGPLTVNETITINATLSGSSTTPFTAVQFNVNVPNGFVYTPAAGPAAIAAGKTLTCNTAGGVMSCIVDGLNVNVIGDGVVATITTKIPGQGSNAAVSDTNLLAASAAGEGVPVTAGGPLSISVTNPCDLNSDGVVDIKDVTIGWQQSGFMAPVLACTSADLNGDGACNVIDIQRLDSAVMSGGLCKVGP